jgi:hypothetical protein
MMVAALVVDAFFARRVKKEHQNQNSTMNKHNAENKMYWFCG